MEETRKLDPRVLLGALAVVCVAAVIWAASAMAGNGSSQTSEPASGLDPAAVFVQNDEQEDGMPQPGDCPERDGGSSGDSGSSTTADA